jgi:tetratricopeptide (TPR) repeat protein
MSTVERRRLWALPPAIQRGPAETIERLGILAEHGEAEGLVLWRLVRDVEIWAATPPRHRVELFTPVAPEARKARLRASTLPTDVRVLLRTLNRILAGPPDAPGCEESAATACAGVAQRAREMEARETAVAFAQAAALTSAEARYALLTGTCAQELGQHARAASWFGRAVGLARRETDWRSYAAGFLALGSLAEAEGEPARARQRYLRAFRTARRHRTFVAERGRAAYALFRLARDAGDVDAASAYARSATRAVMKADPAAAPLALALATFWIDGGSPERSVRLLEHLAKIEALPAHEHLPAAILRVRAETAAGKLIAARRAWADAWALATSAAPATGHVDTLLDLARCAAALGEAGGVEEAGRAALLHAPAADFPRIIAELRRLSGAPAELGTPMKGAA